MSRCSLHVIRASRGAQVIAEVFPQQHSQVWVSDLYSAQRTHSAPQWHVCLAHQLRDCQWPLMRVTTYLHLG